MTLLQEGLIQRKDRKESKAFPLRSLWFSANFTLRTLFAVEPYHNFLTELKAQCFLISI
jgi:hypothetical protein